jgi:hypothetical protein
VSASLRHPRAALALLVWIVAHASACGSKHVPPAPDGGITNTVDAGPSAFCPPDGPGYLPSLFERGGDLFAPAVGDFDGDGLIDILTATVSFDPTRLTQTGGLLLLRARAGATYQQLRVPVDLTAIVFSTGIVEDLNADGLPDLALSICRMTDAMNGQLLVYFGDRVQGIVAGPTATSTACITSLAAGNFLGSATANLAAAAVGPDSTSMSIVRVSPTELTFGSARSIDGTVVDLAAADLDNDGQVDLIAGTATAVVVLRGNGGGTFEPGRRVTSGVIDQVVAQDLDGDGWVDLAFTDRASGEIGLLYGQGGLAFDSRARIPVMFAEPLGIVTADLDADGAPDLVVRYRGFLDGIQALRNLGARRFADPVLVRGGGQPRSVLAKDTNGDHIPDLVLSESDYLVVLTATCPPPKPATHSPPGPFREAPHAPLPQVPRNAGPVITHPQILSITFDDDPHQADVEQHDRFLVRSKWLTVVGQDYGIGSGSLAPGVRFSRAPTTLSSTAIPALFEGWFEAGLVPVPKLGTSSAVSDTIYALHLPQSTVLITDCGGVVCPVCVFAWAYHETATYLGVPFAYVVVPTCIDDPTILQQANSHEFIEAASDPIPPTGVSLGGTLGGGLEEIGDLCTQVGTPDVEEDGFVAQRIWSNTAAAAGTDPCIPAPDRPYYNVSPDRLPLALEPGQSWQAIVNGWSSVPVPDWNLGATVVSGEGGVALLDGFVNNGTAARIALIASPTAERGSSFTVLIYSGLSDTDFNWFPITIPIAQ